MKHIDTILLVKNIDKSKEFYLKYFQLEIVEDWKSMIIFNNRLSIHQADQLFPQDKLINHIKLDSLGSGNIIIYLETKNIETSYIEMVNNKIEILHEIVTFPWNNDKIFRVKDPDGYIIEIGEDKIR